jgi:hypothetical protein
LKNVDESGPRGLIAAFWPAASWLYADYHEDERKVIRELKRHADAEVENPDDAVILLRAAKDARHLFGRSDLATKRHLLTTATIELFLA